MDRIESLRVFLSVAEHGSFTEAARRLGISAGQVSKQISALETRLKKRLLERSTRAVRLTSEGDALLTTARDLVAKMDSLEAGLQNKADDAHGLVRMTAPVVYGARRLAPLLADFMAGNPGISVRLSLSDRKMDLVEEGIDLAIRIGDQADLGLIGKRLSTESIALVASKDYLDRTGRPSHPEELQARECMIDLNMTQPRKWVFHKGNEEYVARVDGRFESDSAEATEAAARAGLGISISPQWCAGRRDKSLELEHILTDWTLSSPEVWALWPPGRYLPARVRKLVDYLTETLPDKTIS